MVVSVRVVTSWLYSIDVDRLSEISNQLALVIAQLIGSGRIKANLNIAVGSKSGGLSE